MKKAIIILSILLGYLLTISAQGVGVNEDGSSADGSAMLDVKSTTKGVLLPRVNLTSTSSSSPISGTPAVGLLVFNLATANDVVPGFYFWTGAAWQAINATSSGSAPLAIGDNAHGGIVFYIFQSVDPGYVSGEEHGLVCTITDLSLTNQWGCYGTAISGADGTAIGTGAQNTLDILAGCFTSGIAADVCASYTGGGFNDWFLPSKEELALMYTNLADSDGDNLNSGPSDPNNLGGFQNNNYWSSTEYSTTFNAWAQVFTDGWQYHTVKTNPFYVRAARAF